MVIFNFSDALLDWFHQFGRKDLPWQHEPSPYRVWVSEIMLQQTQVSTVIPYYQRFMHRFPDINALATAELDEVLAHWAGLGYYARGRNLHKTARIINNEYRGNFPEDIALLQQLPGIGRSTAGAIMALAFQQRHAILDGNVKRVLARFYAIEQWPGTPQAEKQLWQLADALLPAHNIASYIQAQMDLGATLCTRTRPDCPRCPVRPHCQAYLQDAVTEYPRPRPKKQIPDKQVNWLLLLTEDQRIMLIKRPPTGIWGGLWCFPEFSEASPETLCATLDIPAGKAEPLEPFQHTFTHFRLNVQPFKFAVNTVNPSIEDKPDHIWVKMDDIDNFALPAPVKALLNRL